jgi:hypothetical protein
MDFTNIIMMALTVFGSIIFFGGLFGVILKNKAVEEKRKKFVILSLALLICGFLILLIPSVYIFTLNRADDGIGLLYSDSLEGAVFEDDYEKAEKLLKEGANPNEPYMGYDSNDEPIIHAVANNNIEMVKLLLDYGADIEATNSSGNTPLIIAASNSDNTDMIEFLLENGADATAVNKSKATAIHMAAEASNLKAVKILEKAGADIKAKDTYNEDALCYACDPAKVLPSIDLIKYLAEDKKLDVTYNFVDKDGNTQDLVSIVALNQMEYSQEYASDDDYDPNVVSKTYSQVEEYLKKAIKKAEKKKK